MLMDSDDYLAQLRDVLLVERELSNAYIRLRRMIPGAFNTPTAPAPIDVWTHTESCLKRMVDEITQLKQQINDLQQSR